MPNPLDLRAWLGQAERLGELKTVRGADWNLELGAISELNVKKDLPPALLFDLNVQTYLGFVIFGAALLFGLTDPVGLGGHISAFAERLYARFVARPS